MNFIFEEIAAFDPSALELSLQPTRFYYKGKAYQSSTVGQELGIVNVFWSNLISTENMGDISLDF